MKYNIISIGDSRERYKDAIRKDVGTIEEVFIPGVDANRVDLLFELERRGVTVTHPGAFSVGEIGIWLSVIDCWQWSVDHNEEIVVFEDDAILATDFELQLRLLYSEIPGDYDFVCLWIPENQMQDYLYNVTYTDEGIGTIHGNTYPSLFDYGAERSAMVYNGYGNVAQMFSAKGSRFFLDRVWDVGIYTPVDCYQYQEAHAGRCTGYGPKPDYANLVKYDWAPTTVHTTKRFGELYA